MFLPAKLLKMSISGSIRICRQFAILGAFAEIFAGVCIVASLFVSDVESRIVGIKISFVQVILYDPQGFSKTLIMHDFPLTQKSQGVPDIGVIGDANEVIIGGARLLFRGHVFVQIRDGIALGLKRAGNKWNA